MDNLSHCGGIAGSAGSCCEWTKMKLAKKLEPSMGVCMAGENAKVEVRVCEEHDVVWVDATVNGYDGNLPIHCPSIEDAENMVPEVERLITTLYRKAYRDGYFSCQRVIKDALGLPQ